MNESVGMIVKTNIKIIQMNHMQHITRPFLAALSITAMFTGFAVAEPLADLSVGQTGHIEFMASNPEHRLGIDSWTAWTPADDSR